MSIFVDLANRGHRHPSTLARRTMVTVAMIGITMRYVLWWLVLVPLFIILYAPMKAVIAFFQAIVEIPRLTVNQLADDARTWPENWAGAQRIWRARKGPDPVIIGNNTGDNK